jgi:hypothetical protein
MELVLMKSVFEDWMRPGIEADPLFPLVEAICLEAVYQMDIWGVVVGRRYWRCLKWRETMDKVRRHARHRR